jgi:hypothetical protein
MSVPTLIATFTARVRLVLVQLRVDKGEERGAKRVRGCPTSDGMTRSANAGDSAPRMVSTLSPVTGLLASHRLSAPSGAGAKLSPGR